MNISRFGKKQPPNLTPDFIRQPVEEIDCGIDFRPAETIRKFESVGLVMLDSSFRYLVDTGGKIVVKGKTTIDSYLATCPTTGSSFSTTFGSQCCFPMYTMFGLVAALLSKQVNGTPGILSVSGHINAFYFVDESRPTQCFAIITRHIWNGKWKWRACINEVDDECVWPEDTRVHMLHQGDIRP